MKQITRESSRHRRGRHGSTLDEHGAGRMLGSPGRRRSGRRGRAHPRHRRPGCDDRRGQCDRRGRRGAGSHHGHDHGAHPGAGARSPRGRQAIASAPGRRSSCSTATISPPAPEARAQRRLPPNRGRRRPRPSSRPPMPPWRSPARPTIASPACRPSGPPPRRSSMTPLARCARAEARVAGAAARAAGRVGSRERPGRQRRGAAPPNRSRTITAPFDGVVTEKMVEPGNMASPGMPLLRLEDTRGFRLDVRVDESRIGQIRHGASVPVLRSGAAST